MLIPYSSALSWMRNTVTARLPWMIQKLYKYVTVSCLPDLFEIVRNIYVCSDNFSPCMHPAIAV